MYEMLISGVATLRGNRSPREVATRPDISGPAGKSPFEHWRDYRRFC